MPGIGFYQRSKPYLEILRGDTPTDPTNLTETAPVANAVTIYSGQVCYTALNSGVWEWNLGWVDGSVPHLARQDSNSPDVLEAGYLTRLSTLGKFRLRTGYFTENPSPEYKSGTAIKPNGTSGNITTSNAAAGEPVMGYCSAGVNGPLDLGIGTVNGVWVSGENTEATDGRVVTFDTAWSANPS